MGVLRWRLDLMISEVFSNLYDSMILSALAQITLVQHLKRLRVGFHPGCRLHLYSPQSHNLQEGELGANPLDATGDGGTEPLA